MLILLCGDYMTGKTISACSFPKPLTLLDFDGNWLSIKKVKGKDNKLLCGDVSQINIGTFTRQTITPISLITDMGKEGGGSAPTYSSDYMKMLGKYNAFIDELTKKSDKDMPKTLVIDSLSAVVRMWKNAMLRANNIPSLRIPDYGTLESVLFSQFIPTLRALSERIPFIIVTTHLTMDKDALTGRLIEAPVGTSANTGKALGKEFDEVWLQKQEGSDYVWRTRKNGFFQAGSRSNLPDPIKPALYTSIKQYVEG